MNKKPKLIRITTVPISLKGLQKGQHRYISENSFEVVGVSSPGQALNDVTEEEGIRTIAVEMARQPSLLKDLKSLIKLIQLFRKERPDIVHSHTPKAGLLGMIAAWWTNVPNRLHTVAGMPLTVASGLKRKILNITEKITYACATRVYPNSHGLKNIIIENRFTNQEKLKVIANGSSNGIDTVEFDPLQVSCDKIDAIRNDLGITKDDYVFLFVGRVVGDKGINELVATFDAISKSYMHAHLIIVGNEEKELDPLLDSTISIIETHPRIHAVGYKNNVIEYFAVADLFVFPSYREGFPNVVMQSASMQLNAIVSDINGCNEIITDGENGWIVPPRDTNLLQKKMEWCIKNPKQSKTMGLRSRQKMIDKFERTYVHSELLKEYRRILNKDML